MSMCPETRCFPLAEILVLSQGRFHTNCIGFLNDAAWYQSCNVLNEIILKKVSC